MSIDVRVEAALGYGYNSLRSDMRWTDLSPYVAGEHEIAITAARRDEKSVADANECRLTLDNRDGRFTPGYASGAYYPNVKKGVPLRVQVRWPAGTPANWISNPDFETDVTGWQAYTFGYTGGSVARSTTRAWTGTASALVSWPTAAGTAFIGTQSHKEPLVVGRTYTLSFYAYVPTGSPDVKAAVGYTTSGAWMTTKDAWVRCTVTFTASTAYHSLGIECTGTTTGQTAYIDGVQLDEGSAAVTYTTADPSTVLFTRFQGYVDEWPVEWPDGSAATSHTTIVAHSYLSRLQRGNTLKSIIEQEVLLDAPRAYYTFGEAAGALQAEDSAGGGRPALVVRQRGSGGTAVFGNGTGPGTDDLTALELARAGVDDGKYLDAWHSTPLAAGSSDLYTYLEVWASLSSGLTNATVVTVRAAEVATSRISLYTNGLGQLVGAVTFEGGGAGGSTEITTNAGVDGLTHHLLLKIERNATNSYGVSLWVDGVQQGTTVTVTAPTTGSDPILPTFERMFVGGTTWAGGMLNGTLAHLAFYSSDAAIPSSRWDDHVTAGTTGFAPEAAGDRIARLVSYAGPTAADKLATLPASYGDQVALQRTGGAAVLDLLRQVELTDGGVLYDRADGLLDYTTRTERYNAASAFTFDVAQQQIEGDLRVALDDAYLENDISGTRTDGAGPVRLADAASVDTYGPYTASVETLCVSDDALRDLVGWRLALFAEPEPRLPAAATELATQADATMTAALAFDVGTKVTLTNLPVQAPASTLEFFIEGYTEAITSTSYRMVLNLSPAEGYTVWELDDTTLSVLDTTTRLAF